jgi:pathogenesis-related protein 1
MKPAFYTLSFFVFASLLSAFDDRPPAEPENMKGMVARHNYWRSKVKVKPLVWSEELAAFAQKWADELARKGCEMEHRPATGEWGTRYGENIYWSSGMSNEATAVVDSWASEVKFFNPRNGKCSGGVCGHYTQIVWSATTQVGCGMAKCGNEEIWVCNYDPPGNYKNQKPY